jgi:hypothetical protein
MRTGTGKENKGHVHFKRVRMDIHEKEPIFEKAKQGKKRKEKKNPGKGGKPPQKTSKVRKEYGNPS